METENMHESIGMKVETRVEGIPYPMYWEITKEGQAVRLYRMASRGAIREYAEISLVEPHVFTMKAYEYALGGLSPGKAERMTYAALSDAMDGAEAFALHVFASVHDEQVRKRDIARRRLADVEGELMRRRVKA